MSKEAIERTDGIESAEQREHVEREPTPESDRAEVAYAPEPKESAEKRSYGPTLTERVADAPRKLFYGLYTATQIFAGAVVGGIMGWQIAAFFGVVTTSALFIPIVVGTALFTAAGLAVNALWDYFHYRAY